MKMMARYFLKVSSTSGVNWPELWVKFRKVAFEMFFLVFYSPIALSATDSSSGDDSSSITAPMATPTRRRIVVSTIRLIIIQIFNCSSTRDWIDSGFTFGDRKGLYRGN